MSGTTTPTRLLGIDLGARRVGVALSSPEGIVSALKVISAAPDLRSTARLILEILEEFGADGLVIGLPLNMDGTAGPQAARSHALAGEIRRAAPNLPIFLHDERLTSHAADRELAQRAFTRGQKKRRQDAVAARVLLESFLAAETKTPWP